MEFSFTSDHPSYSQYKYTIRDPLVTPGLADHDDLNHFWLTALSVGDLYPFLNDTMGLFALLTILHVPAAVKIYQGSFSVTKPSISRAPEAENGINNLTTNCIAVYPNTIRSRDVWLRQRFRVIEHAYRVQLLVGQWSSAAPTRTSAAWSSTLYDNERMGIKQAHVYDLTCFGDIKTDFCFEINERAIQWYNSSFTYPCRIQAITRCI